MFKVGQHVYALESRLVIVGVHETHDGKALYALAEQECGAPVAYLTEDVIRSIWFF